jgi:hypothetical protein
MRPLQYLNVFKHFNPIPTISAFLKCAASLDSRVWAVRISESCKIQLNHGIACDEVINIIDIIGPGIDVEPRYVL